MHVHTTVSSPCSFIDPEHLADAATAAGMDAICVTEHDEIGGAEVAREICAERGLTVFRGVEIYTEFGDMLVFGLYRDAPSWKTPFEQLDEMCREAGALIIPAHSCRVTGELERVHGPERADYLMRHVDAVETHNGGCTREGNEAALETAVRYGLPGIGGSDAHHLVQVGRCHTLFEDEIRSEEELIAAVRAGRCRGAYL